MSERMEDSPSYRLGTAIAIIRILLGEFGQAHADDHAAARAFLKDEEDRLVRQKRELGITR